MILALLGTCAHVLAQNNDRYIIRIHHSHLDRAPAERLDPCAMERDGAVLYLTEQEIGALNVPFDRMGSIREHARQFRPRRTMSEIGVRSLSTMLNEPFEPREGGRTAAGITQLSYDRYHDPEEGITFFHNLAAAFPHIASIQSIGQSVQGRDLWVLKLSDNPQDDEPGEHSTFFCALHHAREWATHESILHLAEYLTHHYADDYVVRNILDNSVVWLLLAVNPDGFQMSWDVDRFQRKNARGVDLNRNFAYRWGFDTSGSSSSPSSETYRGPSPASEPETQAVQNFLAAVRPAVAISNHTYSQLVLYPWGFTGLITPESYTTLRALGDNISARIQKYAGKKYVVGQCNYTLYPTNGDFTDYAYGELGILAYTVEQRPHSDSAGGFLLPESQILPNAVENRNASLLVMNLVAGAKSVHVEPDLFAPGLNRFSLPLPPVNQKPDVSLGMSKDVLTYFSAFMNNAQFHSPPKSGSFPMDFEGLGVGSAYRLDHNAVTASWADTFTDYEALPHVFDEGSVVMLQNVGAGPNEIGIPGDQPIALADVSIVRRYITSSPNTFGELETVLETRTAAQDIANPSSWIDWTWVNLLPDHSSLSSHPAGANGADTHVHPFRAYNVNVYVSSYKFGGRTTNDSVYFLRFPAPLHGDVDQNGRLDEADFAGLPDCMNGPVGDELSSFCRPYDIDHDFDVDLDDALVIQRQFGRGQ